MHSRKIPEGFDFLRLTEKGEKRCRKLSVSILRQRGEHKAPRTLQALGTVFSLLDRVGSCYWNCPGDKQELHVVQYLATRTGSYGRAALRLAELGYYDEALNLFRSLGEIGNLISLFVSNPNAQQEWMSASGSVRKNRFGPAAVRKAIMASGGTLMMNDPEYGRLCEMVTHPVPSFIPQNFNPHGKGSPGGLLFQEVGLLVVLNEVAVLVSGITVAAARLCQVPPDQRKIIGDACYKCVKGSGSVTLSSLDELWKRLKSAQAVSNGPKRRQQAGLLRLLARQIRALISRG